MADDIRSANGRVHDPAKMTLRYHLKMIGFFVLAAGAFSLLDWLTGGRNDLRGFFEFSAALATAWIAVAGSVQYAAILALRKGDGREAGYVLAAALIGFFLLMLPAVFLVEKVFGIVYSALAG